MKKEIQVKLSDRTVTVRKLPLSKYAELLGAIETLPKELAEFDGKSNDELFANLPKLISIALPQVVKVIAVASDLTEDEVDDLGLDEAADLVVAIIEVNQIQKVAASIKKMLARKQPAAPIQPIGSSGQ